MSLTEFLAAESLSNTILLLAKVTLILIAAWTSRMILRRSNPRWRILVWRVASAGLICVVLLNFNAPFFTIPLLPAILAEADATSHVATTTNSAPSAEGDVASLNASTVHPTSEGNQVRQNQRYSVSDSSGVATVPTAASNKRPTQASERAKATVIKKSIQGFSVPSWSFSEWLLSVWCFGALLSLFRLLVGIVNVARLYNSSAVAPDWVESEFAQIANCESKAQLVDVRQAERISAPCSVGILNNTILLPSAMCDKAHASEVRAILAHEASHFAGHDLRWNFVLQIVSVMLWFHPLVWRIRLAHADDCDERCDAVAAECLQDAEGYGRLLAKIALAMPGRTPTTALSMARTSRIARRIELLHRGIGVQGLPQWKTRTASVVAVALLVSLGAIGVRRSTAQPATDIHVIADNDKAQSKTEATPKLSGRIVDKTGAPVTDATVELTGSRRTDGRGLNHFKSKTDEKGRYLFSEIEEADTYRIRIESTKWVGLTNYRELPQVQLSSQSAMIRDFQLQKACSIRIRVVDDSGSPIPRVSIYSASLSDERWGNSQGVHTGKDGWATIGGLKPSATEYIFGTSSKEYGFAKLVKKLDDPSAQPEEMIVLSKGVDVSGTAICSDGKPAAGWTIKAMPDWWHFGASPIGAKIAEDGTFTLSHVVQGKYDVTVGVPTGERMTRQVRAIADVALPTETGPLNVRLGIPSPQSMTAISGKIVASGRKFQQRISVHARSENGTHRGSDSIMPGEQEFSISPLPPGRYTVTFSSTEVEQKRIPNVKAPTDDMQVELNVIGKPRLIGKVVNVDTKEPLSRFRIRVLKTGHLRGPGYVQDTQWRTIEDPKGEFEVDVVGPGIYQLVAAADNLAVVRSQPINTDEYDGKQLTLELGRGITLTGTVVDKEAQPIDGATVTALSQSSGVVPGATKKFAGEEGAVKTAHGSFVFHNLPAGKEILKVTHPDYRFALSSEIEIREDDVDIEPIVMTGGGTVSGHVYDANGQPQANVTLYFQDQSGRTRLATVVTDEEGYYEAHHLPEQLCDVVRAQQWNDLGVVLTAILPVDGESHRLNLGGKQAVTGRMLVDGKPLNNARVQLGGENPKFGIFKAFAQTDADGAFTFWGPAHGRRFVYYGAPERRNDWIRADEVSIEATKNNVGDINVRSTSLTVSVTGLSAEQAAESRLSLIEYDPIWAHGNDVGILEPRQNPSDPFVFRRVPSGTYELVCRRDDHLALRKVIEVKANKRQQETLIAWPATTGTLEVRMDESICGPGGCNPPNLWSEDRLIHGGLYSREGKDVRFQLIPAGKYYLADKDTRDAPRVLEFSVARGETKILHLTSESYAPQPLSIGFLVVRCFTEQGVPLTGCNVSFGSKGGRIKRNSAQSERQHFIGEPGDYTMTISFPGYETINREVSLHQVASDGKAVGDFEVDVRLAEGG